MTTHIERLTNEEVQEKYRQRVQRFFTQIEEWLPNELEMYNPVPNYRITDSTGTYQINPAAICRTNVQEPDNYVVDIFPKGATVLLGEGILEISGSLGEEKLIYFCQETLPKVEYEPKKVRPIYRGVDLDGWYWLESSMSNRAILVTRDQLFDLIRLVSLYTV
jgi:hypothetical protein